MERWGRSRSCGGRILGREYVSNSTLDKILRAREEVVTDLRTISKIGEKVNEISKQLNKRSKSKSIWKRLRLKSVKQTGVELREMEWKLSEIKKRFALMISHTHIHGDTHVTNANELISNVNLIEGLTIQIARLLDLCDDNFGDIGQSSSPQPQFDDPDYQQFESLTINPTSQEEHQEQQFEAPNFPQFQSLINPNPYQFEYPTQEEHQEQQFEAPNFPQFQSLINPNPDHFEYPTEEEHQFEAPDFPQFAQQQFDTPEFEEFFKIDPTQPTFPADMDPADIPMIDPYPDRGNDYESMRRRAALFRKMLSMMFKDQPNEPRETKFMDVRGLCEDALGYVRSNMGLDYEFVDIASQLVSSYSRAYGYGLHFNFFARQKTAPRHYQAELFFVEVAFGNPVRVIHCAPVVNQPYYLGDAGRPPRSVIFHPNHEYCFHCDLAKNRSHQKGFFLAPPLP